MSRCRVLLNCVFKSGMEDKGFKAMENISEFLLKKGCNQIEIFQDSNNPHHWYYAADWNSLDDAKRVQHEWEEKARELMHFCTNSPKREFFIVKKSHMGKMRKAA